MEASDLMICPSCCNTDKTYFELQYFGGEAEFDEYILCKRCDFLSTRNVKDNDCTTSVVFFDDGEELPETAAFDPVMLKEESMSKPGHRMVISQSARNFADVSWREVVPDLSGSTKSLSALDINGHMTSESLSELRRRFRQQMACSQCSNSLLVPVDGISNIFRCPTCDIIVGIDDSFNMYDLMTDLKAGQYRVEPCSICGNDDPNQFVFAGSGEQDGAGDSGVFFLQCMKCSTTSADEGQTDRDGGMEASSDLNEGFGCEPGNWIDTSLIEYTCKCKNSCADFMNIEAKDDAIFVHCHVCDREDMISLTPKICNCADNSRQSIMFDEFGFVQKITCSGCRAEMECRAEKDAAKPAGSGAPTGRTRILSLSELKMGDHIAWHQTLAYWHHAIVTAISNNDIEIINYDGPICSWSSVKNFKKGKIVKMQKKINPSGEQLYRIDYNIKDCNHPDVVVKRAHQRLDEDNYNILTNNCEHFARWCKTGHRKSVQAETFCKSMLQRAVNFLSAATSYGGQAAIKFGAKALSTPAGNAVSKELGVGAAVGGALNVITPVLLVCREVKMVMQDVHRARKDRLAGNISRDECVKIIIKRTAEGVGSVSGIGIALAIPLLRNPVGYTLATVIGQGVGSIVGRQIGSRVAP